MTANVRIGIVGMGNAGMMHARELVSGMVPGAVLAAVCDRPARLAQVRPELPAGVREFDGHAAMLRAGACDAVVITTPHFQHPAVAVDAFAAGCHVFCEKPAGVRTRDVRRMNRAAARSGKVFTMHFNRRLEPVWKKVAHVLTAGELGAVQRVQWTSTDWFRTDGYYASGGWRGTWAGEGGGLLLNQCIHVLDLWQHFFGLPRRVRAVCGFGKFHPGIEVEDEVTAGVEYGTGVTGVWIAGTGEAPGTNRLEIAGDRGRLVVEDRTIRFRRTAVSVAEFRREHSGFAEPECWECEIPVSGQADLAAGIMKNFIAAIRKDAPLLIPGEEGLRSLEMANAILLSAWTGDWADLPPDERRFETELNRRIAAAPHRPKRGAPAGRILNLHDSFK